MNNEIKMTNEELTTAILKSAEAIKNIQPNELLDCITNLQQENERLKEENKHIFANVNDDQLLRSNAMNYAEAKDYKSRIDKAIEYIKRLDKDYDINVYQEDKHWAYVLYLLNGDDDK